MTASVGAIAVDTVAFLDMLAALTEAGETFIDSSVIAEYLETFNAAPAFLPSDPLERVRVRNLATIADGITDAGVTIFLERKRAAEFQQAGWVERHTDKINRALDLLETQANQADTLQPDGYSLADLSIACSLAWLDFRLPDIDWRKGRPALTAQVTHSLTRPSMIATVPKG